MSVYVLTYHDGDNDPAIDVFDTEFAVREYVASEFPELSNLQIDHLLNGYSLEVSDGTLRVAEKNMHSRNW